MAGRNLTAQARCDLVGVDALSRRRQRCTTVSGWTALGGPSHGCRQERRRGGRLVDTEEVAERNKHQLQTHCCLAGSRSVATGAASAFNLPIRTLERKANRWPSHIRRGLTRAVVGRRREAARRSFIQTIGVSPRHFASQSIRVLGGPLNWGAQFSLPYATYCREDETTFNCRRLRTSTQPTGGPAWFLARLSETSRAQVLAQTADTGQSPEGGYLTMAGEANVTMDELQRAERFSSP
jgi:hypothetical protein